MLRTIAPARSGIGAVRPVRRAAAKQRAVCQSLERRTLLSSAGLSDATFGDSGIASIPPTARLRFGSNAVAVQSDGKVVVVGGSIDSSNGSGLLPRFTLARYNVDGSLDTSFGKFSLGGGNGYFYTDLFSSAGGNGAFASLGDGIVASAVAIQPDGKIVVAGTVTSDRIPRAVVARYLTSGQLDTSFSGTENGTFTEGFGETFTSLALQNDGKIVLAGSIYPGLDIDNVDLSNGDLFVRRLNSDGTYDFPLFPPVIDFGGNDHGNAVTIDYSGSAASNPNYGKIIVAGTSTSDDGSTQQFAVARLTTDLQLDNSFSGDGKLVTPFVSEYDTSIANGVVVQPGGKIVLVGKVGSSTNGNYNFGVLRLNPDGSPDYTFGVSNAETEIDFGHADSANAVLIGQTGDLLIGGSAEGQEALACLTSEGSIDPVFAGGGQEILAVGQSIGGMARGLDGTFVTTGGSDFATDRFFDRGATVHIVSDDSTAAEAGQDTASFRIVRDEAFPYPTRVYYSVSGTATQPGPISLGLDYTGIPADVISRYVDIPGTETSSAPIIITPKDDTVPEDDETVIITLREFPGTYDVVEPSAQTLTILDNDRQISGTVFNDANSNGAFDAGETGLPGWTVFLDTNNNKVLNPGEPSTVTNGDGKYFFGNLGTGTFNVCEMLQSGYRQTVPALAGSFSVPVTVGQVTGGWDFGVTTNALISGTVFDDENGNGVKDSTEAFVNGWLLFADLDKSGAYDPGEPTAVTDANGAYSFNTLAAGTWRIGQVQQNTWVATTPLPNNYFDVTVASGQTSSNHVFGNRQHSISGTVFNDLDRDGVQDSNESGMANVDVWIDTNGNGVFDPLPVLTTIGDVTISLPADTYAITNAAGKYSIFGVEATSYVVQVALPNGYGQSLPLGDAPRTISLITSPVSTGNNFGLDQLVIGSVTTSISGSVFNDLNGDGTRDIENPTEPDNVGWLVWLDTNDNGKLDTGEVSQNTDGGGNFTFANLNAGVTYHLRSELRSGWLRTTPGLDDITLTGGQSVNEKFGVTKQAIISGNVFDDADASGAKNAGETGIFGVKVYLDTDKSGTLDPTETFTTTDSSGNYSFAVVAGTYRIREITPAGYQLDSPASGFFDQTVTAGQTVTGNNFANAPTTDPATLTLQAETATLAGGTIAAHDNGGYTGTGYADYGGNGSSAQWTTTRLAAGSVALVFRYANGGTTNRPLSIVVNGVTIGSVTFAPTGSWTTWKTVSINANLKAGSNTIKTTASTSAGGANIDSLTINTAVPAPVIYQGESATLAGGTIAKHDNTGYTGTGYADFGGTNSSATFTVARTAAGSATLTFRYANGSTANRPLRITVNGSVVASPTFAPTGSWTTWATFTLSVNLLGGSNTIKLAVTGSDGPNLDSLTVT